VRQRSRSLLPLSVRRPNVSGDTYGDEGKAVGFPRLTALLFEQRETRTAAFVAYGAVRYVAMRYLRGMATVLYQCPNTGFRVQGYTDERSPADHDGCVSVICLACKFVHLVNPKSGEVVASRPPEGN